MSRPTPGTVYTVQPGDTLRNIARAAYGNDRGALLSRANSRLLSGRPISREGHPTLYAGDVLDIPASTQRYTDRAVPALTDTEFSVTIGDLQIEGAVATNINRGLNTIADGFTLTAPYNYRDRRIVDAFRAFGFQRATLHIGGEPYVSGVLMKPNTGGDETSSTVKVNVRTRPGDLIECMSDLGSLERTNITLLSMAEEIAERYSLRAFSASGTDGGFFERVEKEATETDFQFLARLAEQKGYLITSSRDGNILLTRAAVDAKPVAALKMGEFPLLRVSAGYDGSKRFSQWFGYAEVTSGQPATAFLRDSSVSVYRPFAFSADESEAGTIEQAVRWRMAKSIADAAVVQATVVGLRNKDGQLWEENMKVSLWFPPAQVFTETEFIVQQVQPQKAGGSDLTVLSLVLPGAYNLEIPSTFPWDGYYEEGA